MRAAWVWFHREVVNTPVFSTSLLFWHAQLRQSGSKMSARGCGQCRSAFTHTQTYASPVSAHNMGGCYCQCPLAEPGLKHAVGAELDSMRKVKLRGLKKKGENGENQHFLCGCYCFSSLLYIKWQVQQKCDKCMFEVFRWAICPFDSPKSTI